ncbi:Synj2 [Symbiodinium natans]|uniref:Synj2 protein n=1 Tax=Symbiodinium natans TaxID=878477 RepID=A0A812QER1_9DINO|nr:Synj2 [Symbiodinium natans]
MASQLPRPSGDNFSSAVAWASAAGETAGAAFKKAAGAARVQAGQVKAVVDSQVWPPFGASSGVASGAARSPFQSDEPHAGSLPPVQIRVCTWNLHGNPIDPSDHIERWLRPDEDAADVIVVGVQELVDLGPKTMVLNTSGDEQRQAALESRVEQALQPRGSPGTYIKICSFGMVGLALLIYIQAWLQPCVRQLRIDRVKTGLDGIGGNKGGVCARFLLGSLSVCAVNVHLASGQHAVSERSQHLGQVLSDAFQSTSSKGALRPAKNGFERTSSYRIAQHDLCIITGDFNARLDLPKEASWPQGSQEALALQLAVSKLPGSASGA